MVIGSLQLVYLVFNDLISTQGGVSEFDWIFKDGGVNIISIGIVGSVLIDFGFFSNRFELNRSIFSFAFGLGSIFVVYEMMFFLVVIRASTLSLGLTNGDFVQAATVVSLIFSIIFSVSLKAYLFHKEKQFFQNHTQP